MKTTNTRFAEIPVLGIDANFFSVNAGIPASFALNEAAAMTASAIETLINAASNLEPTSDASAIHCAIYTLQSACGLIESITRAVEIADPAPNPDAEPLTDDERDAVVRIARNIVNLRPELPLPRNLARAMLAAVEWAPNDGGVA
ncbi:hypothetical protein [Thiocystis violascens]|uniref:Uncharacterized protein n=1 Tax=Thiocystis violascens (strain ATCC 17096 / DSM 198 / 6111) TaxID=765911 RepID=I3YHD9_THIV6|nr:hypothetical protein [Thiocystis violascens]AFL76407.1 hypothetical protein Thivi_4616 [Thiocystis violascens DSM 198]